MSNFQEIQNWEQRRELAAKEENKGGCGCLIILAIGVVLFVNDMENVAIPFFIAGLIICGIISQYEEKQAERNLERFLKDNPYPEVNERIDPSSITRIYPAFDDDESYINTINKPQFEDEIVDSKLNDIKGITKKSKKRMELVKLQNYIIYKIEKIEKLCGFVDDPGASPSIYEGLIDWEDAAGVKNEKHKESWFYYKEASEKIDSTIDRLEEVLFNNEIFRMLQELKRISFSDSLKNKISKDVLTMIVEESLFEIESELVVSYEKSFNNSSVDISFNIYSSENETKLLIIDQEYMEGKITTIDVGLLPPNLIHKGRYAISKYY